jgi:addiction module HigA family antidote
MLLNEHAGISPEMAYRLARALSTSPELWINLQKQRDLWEARETDVSEVRSLVATG